MACTRAAKCSVFGGVLVFSFLQAGFMFALLKTFFADEPFVPAFFGSGIVCLPFTLVAGTMAFLLVDSSLTERGE